MKFDKLQDMLDEDNAVENFQLLLNECRAHINDKVISDQFEVTEAVIDQWRKGLGLPSSQLRKLVLDFIKVEIS